MAVTLPNHHLLTFAPRLSVIRKPSKTLNFPSIQHTRLCKSNVGFSICTSSSSSSDSRRSFKSKSKMIDVEEHDQISENNAKREAKQKYMSTMKDLIQIYKEAILDSDEKTISDIEAMICIIEKEKTELVQKVAALSTDIASEKDKYILMKADFENFRKRSEKEFLSLTSNAQVYLIESLLPMVDSFERTKQQTTPETEKEKKIVTSYQGIYKQFVETMRNLRVAVVATVGKPFNPTHHEAIAREESQEFKEGIIVQEIRRGFRLGDRVLRPARVKVSAGPGQHKSTTEEKTVGQATAGAGLDGSAVPNR